MSCYPAARRLWAVLFLFIALPAFGGKLTRAQGPKVEDVYVVDVEVKDAAVIRRMAQDIATKYKGRVIDIYTEILGGFAIEMSESAALAVSNLPDIAVVYENPRGKVIEAPIERATTTTNWGLDRIDQRALPLDGWYTSYYRGSDVTIYIVDSGVDPVGDLQGRISESKSFSGTNTSDCYPPNGHGTQVASTAGGSIYGVAKGATLVNVRAACGVAGEGSDRLISALQWITARHNATSGAMSVVNISLEYDSNDAIDEAVRDTIAAGVVVVVGAGNDNRSACLSSPQRTGNPDFIPNNPDRYSSISVAASDSNDQVAFFLNDSTTIYASNTGQCVDIFAPGGPGLRAQGYNAVDTNWQGTSAAAPFVAGLAALTLARFGITPGMVEQYIIENSTKNVIRDNDNPLVKRMPESTPNNLVYQVRPAKRRACCS